MSNPSTKLSELPDRMTWDELSVLPVYHCPDEPWTPILAEDVVIGEVLSPFDHIRQMLTKPARYAEAGIGEYWEVLLDREGRRIDTILTYAVATPSDLPVGVTPFRPRQYALVSE